MKVTHEFLVKKGANWLNVQASNIQWRSPFVVTEFSCVGTREIPDIFGLRPSGNVIIEVKVSKSDFLADKFKRGRDPKFLQIGNFRFYLVPEGLVPMELIPEHWGLLEWTGRSVKVSKKPVFVDADDKALPHMYHSVLRRILSYQVIDFKNPKLL